MSNDRKQKGITAVNQEFRRYDQVRKEQTYRLSEASTEDEFDDDFIIETCDLSQFSNGGAAGQARFAEQLGRAMESIGFAILVNHDVDTRLYAEAIEATKRLFESTTREQREKYLAQRTGSVNQGYFPVEETTIIHPDLVVPQILLEVHGPSPLRLRAPRKVRGVGDLLHDLQESFHIGPIAGDPLEHLGLDGNAP